MIFQFPDLSGPYVAGTTSHHIIDQNRKELSNPTEQRELMIHIWYPAQNNNKKTLTLYDSETAESIKSLFSFAKFPEEQYRQLSNVYTHAQKDTAINKQNAPYPVILFSHGFFSPSLLYTEFFEQLASHGYIVIGISHTYYTTLVTFPDNRKIFADQEIPKRAPNGLYNPADLQIWLKDVQCVLDHLEQYNENPNDLLYQTCDMKKIGIFGHSFGGSIAFQATLKDPRIKAGISLDGAIFGEDTNFADLKHPFLFLFAQDSPEILEGTSEEISKKHGCPVKIVEEIREEFKKIYPKNPNSLIQPHILVPIKHGGFSDMLILQDLPIFKENKNLFDVENMTGSTQGRKDMNVLTQEIIKFFDTFLKNS